MSQYKSITPPKGSLRSPVTQTIVNHLQANGPTGIKAINSALAHIDGYDFPPIRCAWCVCCTS